MIDESKEIASHDVFMRSKSFILNTTNSKHFVRILNDFRIKNIEQCRKEYRWLLIYAQSIVSTTATKPKELLSSISISHLNQTWNVKFIHFKFSHCTCLGVSVCVCVCLKTAYKNRKVAVDEFWDILIGLETKSTKAITAIATMKKPTTIAHSHANNTLPISLNWQCSNANLFSIRSQLWRIYRLVQLLECTKW